MANLVLFKVEKVEVLKAQDLGRGRMVTTLVIEGGDGRFEVSLHSDGPVEIKTEQQRAVMCCRCLREIVPGEPMGSVNGYPLCGECGANA